MAKAKRTNENITRAKKTVSDNRRLCIGHQLRTLRRAAKKNLKDMADSTGESVTWHSKVETGRVLPTSNELLLILDACNSLAYYDELSKLLDETPPVENEGSDIDEKVMQIILETKRKYKGQAWAGSVPCPKCSGKLQLSHAKINGHVWGMCTTKDCLMWME